MLFFFDNLLENEGIYLPKQTLDGIPVEVEAMFELH